MEVLTPHVLHVAVALMVAFCAAIRSLVLPRRLLPLFLMLVAVHWSEHIAQLAQIYLLGWARPSAGGILGLLFPVLVKREWLHTGFSLIMLVGLFGFRGAFTRQARIVWMVALGIQAFHTLEHQILFLQAMVGLPPVSLVQAVLPPGLRPELHLFYNGAVSAPMFAAQVLMLLGGDAHIFQAFYHMGRRRGHPPLYCLRLAWAQARAYARPGYWQAAWSINTWDVAHVREVTRRILDVWRETLPSESLSLLQGVDGVIDNEVRKPNFTILSAFVQHDITKEQRPTRLMLVPTASMLDMLEGLGPEMFSEALAVIAGHELAHISLHMRGSAGGVGDRRTVENEIDADREGILLAEKAGYSNARLATLRTLQVMSAREDRSDRARLEGERRIAALGYSDA